MSDANYEFIFNEYENYVELGASVNNDRFFFTFSLDLRVPFIDSDQQLSQVFIVRPRERKIFGKFKKFNDRANDHLGNFVKNYQIQYSTSPYSSKFHKVYFPEDLTLSTFNVIQKDPEELKNIIANANGPFVANQLYGMELPDFYGFVRLSEFFEGNEPCNAVNFETDLVQNAVGNCFLIATLMSVAQICPDEIVETIVYWDSKGCAIVRLFQNGIPHYILVDDLVPVSKTTILGVSTNSSNFWGMLIEKAIAVYQGSYQSMIGGRSGDALQYLMATPIMDRFHCRITEQEMEKALKDAFFVKGQRDPSIVHNRAVFSYTQHARQATEAIHPIHTYLMTDFVEDGGKCYVELLDPHGRTQAQSMLPKRLHHLISGHPGKFWLPLGHYMMFFGATCITKPLSASKDLIFVENLVLSPSNREGNMLRRLASYRLNRGFLAFAQNGVISDLSFVIENVNPKTNRRIFKVLSPATESCVGCFIDRPDTLVHVFTISQDANFNVLRPENDDSSFERSFEKISFNPVKLFFDKATDGKDSSLTTFKGEGSTYFISHSQGNVEIEFTHENNVRPVPNSFIQCDGQGKYIVVGGYVRTADSYQYSIKTKITQITLKKGSSRPTNNNIPLNFASNSNSLSNMMDMYGALE
eukprot:TRINITY_DN3313_c0_g1_i2.p1 TRINITY_DN3313_c0_g1~~TRINITY_DN3313_c0_g1_i2.p1  ORF type:complete len:641 (+),score=153.72 TRINITY_DN3313_c0_g1_i2:422-2344(+)